MADSPIPVVRAVTHKIGRPRMTAAVAVERHSVRPTVSAAGSCLAAVATARTDTADRETIDCFETCDRTAMIQQRNLAVRSKGSNVLARSEIHYCRAQVVYKWHMRH